MLAPSIGYRCCFLGHAVILFILVRPRSIIYATKSPPRLAVHSQRWTTSVEYLDQRKAKLCLVIFDLRYISIGCFKNVPNCQGRNAGFFFLGKSSLPSILTMQMQMLFPEHAMLLPANMSSRDETFEKFIADLRLGFDTYPTLSDIRTDTQCPTCQFSTASAIQLPISPVPHIFASNQVPSPRETVVVKNVLESIRPEVSRSDAAISQTMAVLVRLLHQRQKLREYEEGHKILLSPMRRLPAELLSEIFLQCLPEGPPRCAPSCHDAPLLLGRVCRQWRAVAWSTPRLWTNATFRLQRNVPPDQSLLMRSWIARSGVAPLSLHLYRDWRSAFEGELSFDDVIHSSTRWRSLILSMHLKDVRHLLPVKSLLPALQEVELDITQPEQTPLTSEPLDVFEHAPQLRSVAIYGAVILHPTRVRFPWRQLTKLVISNHDPVSVLEVMRCCENLVHCNYDIYPMEDFELAVPEVRLTQLRKLSCYGGTNLLNVLTLPALQDLEVLPFEVAAGVWLPQLSSLLSRSRCRITRLALVNVAISSEELVRCLREMPEVVDLKIVKAPPSHDLPDDLFKRLTLATPPRERSPHATATAAASTPLLRRLQTLAVFTDLPCSIDLMALMAESRRRRLLADVDSGTCAAKPEEEVAQIQFVHLKICNAPPSYRLDAHASALAKLEGLKADGFYYAITLTPEPPT